MRRVVRVTAGVLLGASVVTACSDDSADTVTPAGSSSPGAAVTPGPGASPTAPAVPPLPESDLPELEGYSYAQAADVPETVPGLSADYVSGYIGREVRKGQEKAAVLQVVRLKRGTEGETAEEFVDAFVQQYAQTNEFKSERVAGQRVRTTSLLRGRPGGLVTWYRGRDLVLVSAEGGVSAARRVAREYLEAT